MCEVMQASQVSGGRWPKPRLQLALLRSFVAFMRLVTQTVSRTRPQILRMTAIAVLVLPAESRAVGHIRIAGGDCLLLVAVALERHQERPPSSALETHQERSPKTDLGRHERWPPKPPKLLAVAAAELVAPLVRTSQVGGHTRTVLAAARIA